MATLASVHRYCTTTGRTCDQLPSGPTSSQPAGGLRADRVSMKLVAVYPDSEDVGDQTPS